MPRSLRAGPAICINEVIAKRKSEQRRAWLVRGSSVRGANVVSEWLTGGSVSLSASQLRAISPHGISEAELREIAASDYEHLKHQELKSKLNEIVAFVTKMSPGDVVITTSDQSIFVGDVTDEWSWQASKERENKSPPPSSMAKCERGN